VDANGMMIGSDIPDKVRATIMLKLSKNNECSMDEIVENYDEIKNDVYEFVLDNYTREDICYAFKKANVPYTKVMHLASRLIEIECLFDIYSALYGVLIDDMLDI